jgi:hypothetical protein
LRIERLRADAWADFVGRLSRDSENPKDALKLLTFAKIGAKADGKNATVESVLLGPGFVQGYVRWLGGEMRSLDAKCRATMARHDALYAGTWWDEGIENVWTLGPLRKAALDTACDGPGLRIYQLIRALVLIPAPSDETRKKYSTALAKAVEENYQAALEL